jgi:hypothetical protein
MCLVLLGLFAGAFATPLEIVNNCEQDYVTFFFTKNDEKFTQWWGDEMASPFRSIPGGISSHEVNDTYIEFWGFYSPDVFDESGSRLMSEKFVCDEFDDGSLCSKLKIPSRDLFYVGDVGTIYLCSVKNDADIVSIVNNCDYEPTMFVYQSSNDKIKNFKPDVNESFYNLATDSTTFVIKKGALTFVEILTITFDVNDAIGRDFPSSDFFDDDNKPVVPKEYMCVELSSECGAYAEDKVKMIDVTNMKTLYMCATEKKSDSLPSLYRRKLTPI